MVVLPPADWHERIVIFFHYVLEEEPFIAKLARLKLSCQSDGSKIDPLASLMSWWGSQTTNREKLRA